MTTNMGPPPPKTIETAAAAAPTVPSTEPESKTLDEPISNSMAPPTPPEETESLQSESSSNQEQTQSNPPQIDSNPTDKFTDNSNSTPKQSSVKQELQCPNVVVPPYTIPTWSEPPCYPYSLQVLKDGSIIDQFHVNEKGAYMFGRVDLCDFMLDHPTISRFHAVLQFKSNGDAYLYDLGSTHGTYINKNQVKEKVYVELHVGDVIRFGHSSRLYIFEGPSELMLPEDDMKRIRNAKIRVEMKDMEVSLLRAKREASLAEGISWGMGEDAIEEIEDDVDEITWQTFKGQLTEKQEKTREKVLKRLEKMANMKKEIDAIRAKDIAQGGLTQGQQTQIARNEQRISQVMEELENLEETLNESIRESLGARAGRTPHGKKKGATEDDEEEYLSDEDEFYDRTKKLSERKGGENQSIETADSLLDKKDAIVKEMEDKRKLFLDEERVAPENDLVAEAGDALDEYMSGLSSQLVLDKTEKLQKELSNLQSQLDRVLYLLKIADPTGEAASKREFKAREPKPITSTIPTSGIMKPPPSEKNKRRGAEQTASDSIQKKITADEITEISKKPEESEIVADATKRKSTAYPVGKPQWLGAVADKETEKTEREETQLNVQESDQFVDYKDRKRIQEKLDTAQVNVDPEIENAAPGLIIRKRKQVEKSSVTEIKGLEVEGSTSLTMGAGIGAEDAVALLLKHARGYHASEDEVMNDHEDQSKVIQSGKDNKKPKKVLGPERPLFLDGGSDYESWVPPEGQSGDGRTSLNDRYGY